MTIAERETVDNQILELQDKATRFDELQADIDRYERLAGNVAYINIIGGNENVQVTDPTILGKAENLISSMIDAAKAEQAAL